MQIPIQCLTGLVCLLKKFTFLKINTYIVSNYFNLILYLLIIFMLFNI